MVMTTAITISLNVDALHDVSHQADTEAVLSDVVFMVINTVVHGGIWVHVCTVNSFSALNPVVRKTKNNYWYRFSHYRVKCEMRKTVISTIYRFQRNNKKYNNKKNETDGVECRQSFCARTGHESHPIIPFPWAMTASLYALFSLLPAMEPTGLVVF